jgi:sensor histidine kinase regulating citrate/malate metabolism
MKQENLSDPDMQKATAALIRAAKRARELAQQTGTEFVVVRDGQLVREIPHPVLKKRTPKTVT